MLRQLKCPNEQTSRMSCFVASTPKKKVNKQNYILPGLIINKLKINQRPQVNKTQTKGIPALRIIQDARELAQVSNCQEVECSLKTPSSHKNSFQMKRQQLQFQTNGSKFIRKSLLPPIQKAQQNLQASPIKSFSSHNDQKSQQKKKKQKLKSDCKLILQRNCQFPFLSRNLVKPKFYKNQDKILDQNQQIDFNCTHISQIELKQDPQLFISKESMKDILNL